MGRVHQVTTSTDQSADDRMYARACYDTLVVMQPHVRTEGLWRVGDDFQIVCPNLETEIADDGRPIADWFEDAMVAGAPVRLMRRGSGVYRPATKRATMALVMTPCETLTQASPAWSTAGC